MNVTAATLEKAIAFALEKHKNVTRKGDGRPYILHPMSVLITLMAIKKSKNIFLLATVAILHDVVEDCDVTIEEIAELFGYHVAAMVQDLTSDKEEIERIGKTQYLINKMLKMSTYTLCIKLVDRLDNIKDMVSMSESFRQKQIDSTTQILEALENGRKLTKTHKLIIGMIRKEMAKYKLALV
jgi:(p)ppGpp synthase/HD superfamily hydrolase